MGRFSKAGMAGRGVVSSGAASPISRFAPELGLLGRIGSNSFGGCWLDGQLRLPRDWLPPPQSSEAAGNVVAPERWPWRTLAWQSTDPYVAPDFERFFADDREGGIKLDQLFKSRTKDSRADDEIFRTVRAGLRRTSQHRTLILAWLGNRYIWGKSPQNPQAVEIMYHATDLP